MKLPRQHPQGGIDDADTDALSNKSQILCFDRENLRLKATRQLKELLDDASNEGREVRGHRQRQQWTRSMQ
jgi:hypothetical protein